MKWIFVAAGLGACSANGEASTDTHASHLAPVARPTPPARPLVVGAAQLGRYLPGLRGKRVGLVVNQTSRIGNTY